MGCPDVSVGNCDWCGGSLIFVNDRIMCELCRKYKGKDGKEHLIENGKLVSK